MYNVAIVGATGVVGTTFLKALEDYDFPIKNLFLFASSKSVGKTIIFKGKEYQILPLTEESFNKIDIALFSAGSEISKIYAPIAAAKGVLVIDNSSCFRNDPKYALVVPEVNFSDVKMSKIIANPNCSTIQSVIPLKALQDKYGLKRVVYTTYQAVSGSGMKGISDLNRTLKGEKPIFYPHDISKTCIPEIDVVGNDDYTKEEIKMINETRKILHLPSLKVSATCVRVPVLNSHAVSIMVELNKEFEIVDVINTLSQFPSIVVVNDLSNHLYPTSIMANGNDKVYVGRIRRDLSCENGLLLYVVSDNIRKGAASNAVQIAKEMHLKDLIRGSLC